MKRLISTLAIFSSILVVACGPATPSTTGDGGTTDVDGGGPGCEIGARRCQDARTAQTCADPGLWEDVPCATGTACHEGLCLQQVCEPAATRCNPDGRTLERCNATGTGWDAEPCATPGACVEGACVSYICQPGESRCASATVAEICVADGSGWAADPCNTAAGEGCFEGLCRVPACTPGETRCADAETLQTCAADANGWESSRCPQPGLCEEGSCVALACTPGERRCAGASAYETCAPDGSGWIGGTCATGETCSNGWCGGGCADAYDCDLGQICDGGRCADFQGGCAADGDCPQDHVCTAFFGICQGCGSDAHCLNSPNGPKCDVTDDGQGPGVGYCYAECGTGIGGCGPGMVCDETRGGLCVPACSTNADCSGGLVCIQATWCAPCETDGQCGTGMLCTQGECVEDTGCTHAQCRQNLGDAYFCDAATDTCVLGCTAGGCASSDPADCNPCPSGSTCDAVTHACVGSGCTACSTDCSATGMVCDLVSCQCVTPGGGTGDGAEGDPCISDADCGEGLGCSGDMPQLGVPGQCAVPCTNADLCACPSGTTCMLLNGEDLGLIACMMGMTGWCM